MKSVADKAASGRKWGEEGGVVGIQWTVAGYGCPEGSKQREAGMRFINLMQHNSNCGN